MKYITAIICALLVFSLTAYILIDTFLIPGNRCNADDEVSEEFGRPAETNSKPAAAGKTGKRRVSDIVRIG